ncbi:hypothetical protein JXI42_10165 [bacterium]|nr:hypothetical protein [bacterium]
MKTKTISCFLVLIISLCFSSILYSQEYLVVGARPVGMGEAYVPIADDAYALRWNPAGLDMFRGTEFIFSYTKLLWGLSDDNLNEGFAGYVHHLNKYGSVGVSAVVFYSRVFQQTKLGLSYAKKLTGECREEGLSLGFTIDLLRDEIVKSRIEEADPNDPLLTGPAALMAPVIDIAILQKFKQTDLGGINLGATVQNLNQPDVSREGGGKNRLPLYIKPGIAYVLEREFKLNASLGMTFRSDPVSIENKSRFNFGFEGWVYDVFAVRGGVKSGYGKNVPEILKTKPTYTVGTSLRIKTIFDIEVDYALLIPTTEHISTFKTHRFSLILRPQVTTRLPDLIADVNTRKLDEPLLAGKQYEIDFIVRNAGEKDARDFSVSVVQSLSDTDSFTTIFKSDIDNLEAGEDTILVINWAPDKKGQYELRFTVDDDGENAPKINGRIEELHENNNSRKLRKRVYTKPEGSLVVEPEVIRIKKLSEVIEEAPVVPFVFFEQNSWTVPDRFVPLLNLITGRLLENRNTQLEVKGFYNPVEEYVDDPEGGRELAQMRAEQVRKRIISRSRELQNRVVLKSSGYDPGKPRAGDPVSLSNNKDAALINEENRRVEFSIILPGAEEISIPFEGDMDSILSTAVISPRKDMLSSDPGILLLLTIPQNYDIRYLENKLTEVMGVSKERIFINFDDSLINEAFISLCSDYLLFAPYSQVENLEEIIFEDSELNITVNVEYDSPIKNMRINFIDSAGKVLTTICDEIKIGEKIPWNWKDDKGNYVYPDDKRIRLVIEDSIGLRDTVYSNVFRSIQIEERDMKESILLTQCEFDRPEVSSSSQLYKFKDFAEKIIEEVQEGASRVGVAVTGHTDNIGTEDYNLNLSLRRAEYGREILLKYLSYYLGFHTPEMVHSWLLDNSVEITASGAGSSEPVMNYGEAQKEFSGLNFGYFGLPENRILNRCIKVDLLRSSKQEPGK